MTVMNNSLPIKKELPVYEEDTREKCQISKFESVIIAMMVSAVLLYTAHLVISSYSHHLPALCYLSKQPGNCRAYFKSWYYDSKQDICKEFVYGGCDGNENNFQSEQDCLQICSRKPLPNILMSKSNEKAFDTPTTVIETNDLD